jgi:uncharacterized protein (DUF433 family)
MDIRDIVTIDREILSGEPVFAGTRVPGASLVAHLTAGESIGDFLEGFPSVRREQATAFLRRAFHAALDDLAQGSRTMTELLDRIVTDPEIRSGKPIVRGTRITVLDVLEYLAGGMTVDEILDDFPQLSPDDLRAIFAFAAERERMDQARR